METGIYVGVGMTDTTACPPAHCKLGFQSSGIAYAQMREHVPRMRGAGLGAETQTCIDETVTPALPRI